MVRTRYWLPSRDPQSFVLSMALCTVVNAPSQAYTGLSAALSAVVRLWSLVKGLRRSVIIRAAVGVAGITAVLALQPAPGRSMDVTSVRVLLLSAQARRYLFLQYQIGRASCRERV